MEKEMEEMIIEQLLLKPRKLVNAEEIGGDKSCLFGNGKNVWGIAERVRGDVTDIDGSLSGVTGDVSRFVGCVTGINASDKEIIAVLEEAGKVIKQRV